MALIKEIIDNRGVKLGYHRISNFIVDKDNNKILVRLKSYTEEQYRNLEKEHQNFITAREEKMQKLNELILQNLDGTKTLEIQSLTDKINSMYENNVLEQSTFVSETSYDLNYTENENYNLTRVYELMKQEALFEGSVDC